jgi:hypothetical protein
LSARVTDIDYGKEAGKPTPSVETPNVATPPKYVIITGMPRDAIQFFEKTTPSFASPSVTTPSLATSSKDSQVGLAQVNLGMTLDTTLENRRQTLRRHQGAIYATGDLGDVIGQEVGKPTPSVAMPFFS